MAERCSSTRGCRVPRWISCATCHNPVSRGATACRVPIGHGMQQLGRRTPTILNLAWAPALFWDGRAESLEEQALGPIEAAGEMNMNLDEMVERLEAIRGYRPLFEQAYPGEPISAKTVAKAIATFERGVVSGQAPFDRWIAGDEKALSPRRAAWLRAVQREGAAAARVTLAGDSPMIVSTTSGWRTTMLAGQGDAANRARAFRVQDADPSQRRAARPVHARWIGRDAGRGHRSLQPRRRSPPAEPVAGDQAGSTSRLAKRKTCWRSCRR